LFLTRKSAAASKLKKINKNHKNAKRVHSAVWHFLFANTIVVTVATTFVVAVVVETTTTTRKETYY
jgi:spore maturation protein SpmA